MRFLDFPDWVGQLALLADTSAGGILIALSLLHIFLIIVSFSEKIRAHILYRFFLCVALLELPFGTVFLLFVAGLPKA